MYKSGPLVPLRTPSDLVLPMIAELQRRLSDPLGWDIGYSGAYGVWNVYLGDAEACVASGEADNLLDALRRAHANKREGS